MEPGRLHVRTWTVFLPIQQSACIFTLGSPYFSRLTAGFEMSWAVMAFLSWPIAFSTSKAAWDIIFAVGVGGWYLSVVFQSDC